MEPISLSLCFPRSTTSFSSSASRGTAPGSTQRSPTGPSSSSTNLGQPPTPTNVEPATPATPTAHGGPLEQAAALVGAYQALCHETSAALGVQATLHVPPECSGLIPPESPAVAANRRSLSPPSMRMGGARGPTAAAAPGVFAAHILAPSNELAYLARANLLRNNPARASSTVRVHRGYLLTSTGELKPGIKADMDEIKRSTGTEITVLGESRTGVRPPPGVAPERTAVEVTGAREAVDLARVRFLVALDARAGLFVDGSLDLDPKCHYVVAGRKAADLHHIMRLTQTNIYLPSPFAAHWALPPTAMCGWENHLRPAAGHGQIFITGEKARVMQAREMLVRAAHKSFKSQQIHLTARKLDWMITHRKDLVLRFMYDNGTFIAFPPLGSGQELVTVYGDNSIYISRTVRSLARLACDFYVAYFKVIPSMAMGFSSLTAIQQSAPHPALMVPGGGSAPGAPPAAAPGAKAPLNPASALLASQLVTFRAALGTIAELTETEIVQVNDYVEVYGSDAAVAEAYGRIAQLDYIRRANRSTTFRVELGMEHKDFISGKKNGKINKITKTTGVDIEFNPIPNNALNMWIDVSTPDTDRGLEGFSLLKDELPAEISFHIPEVHHKRIIGVGGRNIQKIMKRFGVFVKFSNADEHASLGGYFDNDDNVIARTPAKNAANLIPLKATVYEAAQQQSTQHYGSSGLGPMGASSSIAAAASAATGSAPVPPSPAFGTSGTSVRAQTDLIHYLTCLPIRYHRLVEACVPGIEAAAVVKIRMPNRETGNDEVLISGMEPNVKLALNLLAECTPETFAAPVIDAALAQDLLNAVYSPTFKTRVVDAAKTQLDIEIAYVDDGDALSPRLKPMEPPGVGNVDDASAGTGVGAPIPGEPVAYFTFRCARKSVRGLPQAQEMLVDYLKPLGLADAVSFAHLPGIAGASPEASLNAAAAVAAAAAADLRRVAALPAVDSHFQHFNARLFSAGPLTNTVPAPGAGMQQGPGAGVMTAAGAFGQPPHAVGVPPPGFPAAAAPPASPPTLRDIFEQQRPGASTGPGAYPPQDPARRDHLSTLMADAYSSMISPTTAAELPFLAPDRWSTHPSPPMHGVAPPPTQQEYAPYGGPTSPPPGMFPPGLPRGFFDLGGLMHALPPPSAPAPSVRGSPAGHPAGVQQPTPPGATASPAMGGSGGTSAYSPPPGVANVQLPVPSPPGMAATLPPPPLVAQSSASELSSQDLRAVLSSPDAVGTLCALLRLDDKYRSLFHEQEVDLGVLLGLGDADLRELGVTAFGPRRKLVQAIQELARYAAAPKRMLG
ncbi:hypothetical protein GGF31_004039 [Allomyces arbusculus]|nr:hypothetical protein GGF31_004039 [Allomyces arbusculus]